MPDKLGDESIEEVYKRGTEQQACQSHGASQSKDGQRGTGKVVHDPLGGFGINKVVKDPVQAEKNQCVLPQPDDDPPLWGCLGQEKDEQRPCNGCEWKEEKMAV